MKSPGSKIRSFSPKAYWRECLAVLMLLLAIVFFRCERKELMAIFPQIRQADQLWIVAGLVVALGCVVAQAGIYKRSFAAIGLSLPWLHAITLFLKRNLISVFLPAGGVSALAYSPSELRKTGFNKTQVHQASGLFGFAGLLTVFLAGLPVMIYIFLHTSKFRNASVGLIAVTVLITSFILGVRSFRNKGYLYKWIEKKISSLTPFLNDLFAANVSTNKFSQAVACSMGVEACGMLHVYIAMMALGLPASFGASASAYIISVLMMVASPFLRGPASISTIFTAATRGSDTTPFNTLYK